MEILYLLKTLSPINWWNLFVIVVGSGVSVWFINKYGETKSHQLLNSLPGVWTSLGVFCTFAAICVSLSEYETSEIEITKIIKDLIPAFSTSMWGLIGAFALTIYSKKRFAEEEAEELQALEHSPEEYIRDIALCSSNILTVTKADNSELQTTNKEIREMNVFLQATFEQIKAIAEQQKAQSKLLKDYSEKLNKNISSQSALLKTFVDDFVRNMDEIFKNMKKSTEKQVKEYGKAQFDKANDVIIALMNELSASTNLLINGQNDSVKEMMKTTNKQLSTIASKITTNVDKITTEASTILKEIKNDQATELKVIVKQQKDFVSKINQQMEASYTSLQQHNVESLQQMIDLQAAYEEMGKKMLQDSQESNKAMSDEFKNSLLSISLEIQQAIKTHVEALNDTIKKNVAELKESYDFIQGHIGLIKENYAQATEAYVNAVELVHEQNDTQIKTLASINTSASEMVATNNNVQAVLDLVTLHQDNTHALVTRIQEMSTAIESLQELESLIRKIVVAR